MIDKLLLKNSVNNNFVVFYFVFFASSSKVKSSQSQRNTGETQRVSFCVICYKYKLRKIYHQIEGRKERRITDYLGYFQGGFQNLHFTIFLLSFLCIQKSSTTIIIIRLVHLELDGWPKHCMPL